MIGRIGKEDGSLPLSAAGRVDARCDRFEEAWIAGQTPRIEDFLEEAAEPERPELLRELVRLEVEYRRRRGEDPKPLEYRQRFPEHADRIEALFGPSTPGPVGEPVLPLPAVAPVPEADRGTWSEEPVTRVLGQPLPPVVTVPEQFGRYHILRFLGEGGMGSVYLAHDTQLDREIALKVPRFAPEDGTAAVERFIRSARAAATLAHPNLCPVYDAGQFQGIPYLTMPYLEGRSLAALLRDGPTMPPDRAVALVQKLAVALQVAHQKGIVHRDLNPTNILLTPADEPIVMDFGLARREGSARLTQTGQVLGTPGYIAPEQLSGNPEAQGSACDIFSLGVILYELLTGELPFGRSFNEVLLRIMTTDPHLPSACRQGIDPALDAICSKALARKVEDRYRSMGKLAEALHAYLANRLLFAQPTVVPGTPAPEPVLSTHPLSPGGEQVVQQPGERPSPSKKAARGRRGLRFLWLGIAAGVLIAGSLVAAGRFIHGPGEQPTQPDSPQSVPSTPAPERPQESSQTGSILPGSQSVPSTPSPELLLFSSNTTGKYQLVLLALNGTEATLDKTLTGDPSNNTEPVWSPDGKQIVFVSDRAGMNNVYIMDADGGNVRQLSRGMQPAHLATWAPDGKRIAYSVTEGKKGQVLAMNVDGTNTINLTPSLAWAGDPAWSPDGKQIALAVNPQGFGVRLCVMDADGSNSQMLSTTDNPLGHVHPSWSPDGRKIAFGDGRDQRVEIVVCEADGANQKQLTHLGGINSRASWSPDGTKIAFRHFDNREATSSTLFLMQADGSNLRPIKAPVQGACQSRLMWRPR